MAANGILAGPMVSDGLLNESYLFLAVDLDCLVGLQKVAGIKDALVHPVDGPQDFPLVRNFRIDHFSFEESFALWATALEKFLGCPHERLKGHEIEGVKNRNEERSCDSNKSQDGTNREEDTGSNQEQVEQVGREVS